MRQCSTESREVRVYDASGRHLGSVGGRGTEPGRYESQLVGRAATAAGRGNVQAWLDRMPRHQSRPAFASVRLDRAGNLWVRELDDAIGETLEHAPGGRWPSSVWQVFGRGGVHEATVRMPPGFEILELGEHHVLGLVRDAGPVERVVLYNLEKDR